MEACSSFAENRPEVRFVRLLRPAKLTVCLSICLAFLYGNSVVAQPASSSTVTRQSAPARVPNFSDNFDGAAGTLPSSANWLTYSGPGYRTELERYTSSPSNVRLDGHGHLLLIAHKNASGWTSGEVQSKINFEASPGQSLLIEARIELPNGGPGYWPAVWAVAQSYRSDPHSEPAAGEVDIAETISDYPWVDQFVHCGPTDDGRRCLLHGSYGHEHYFLTPSGEAGWHVYSWEWVNQGKDPYMQMSVGGTPQLIIYKSEVSQSNWDAAFEHPYYLIMNLAIGGWAGRPTSATKSTATMSIDYVKIFRS